MPEHQAPGPGSLLMKRCHHCGGRFGLVRHRHYTLSSALRAVLKSGSAFNPTRPGKPGFWNGYSPALRHSRPVPPRSRPGMTHGEGSIRYIVAYEVAGLARPPLNTTLLAPTANIVPPRLLRDVTAGG